MRVRSVIYPNFRFSLDLTEFFPRMQLIQFLANNMQDFQTFVLHYCILNYDAEQVYLKLQVINLKNKEVTANPKPQTLEIGLSKTLNPKPWNPKHRIRPKP